MNEQSPELRAQSLRYRWGQIAGALTAASILREDDPVTIKAITHPAVLAPYLALVRTMGGETNLALARRLAEIVGSFDFEAMSDGWGDVATEMDEAAFWIGYANEQQKWRAGRPRPDKKFDTLTERCQVRLSATQVDKARTIGHGNVALGLRVALNAFEGAPGDDDR